jgi:hypothetical protein
MDGWRVKLGMSDEDFCRRLNTRLADQLAAISPRVDELVAFIHHLPVAELVPPDRPDRFAFAAAFLGAERFGQTLLRCEKLTHVYCGHSHWPGRVRLGGVEIVNVGSTYIEKHLCALEVDDS